MAYRPADGGCDDGGGHNPDGGEGNDGGGDGDSTLRTAYAGLPTSGLLGASDEVIILAVTRALDKAMGELAAHGRSP